MTNRVFTTGIAVIAAIGLWAAPAFAQAVGSGQVSVTLKGGWQPTIGGVMHEGGSGSVLNLTTVVEEKKWGDTHENNGFGFEGGIGFGVSDNAEIVANFEYGQMGAKILQVGTVAGLQLLAEFDDYKYWGLNGGARFFFGGGGAAPYVTVLGGVRQVSELPGTFSVPAAGVVLADTPFFKESWVPTFGADLGVLFGAGRTKFGFEGGFRYAGGPEGDDSGFAGTGLENLNDKGSRWSFPISAVLRF